MDSWSVRVMQGPVPAFCHRVSRDGSEPNEHLHGSIDANVRVSMLNVLLMYARS
jgi:hypothetical protein